LCRLYRGHSLVFTLHVASLRRTSRSIRIASKIRRFCYSAKLKDRKINITVGPI
jgi:hypothetical protein